MLQYHPAEGNDLHGGTTCVVFCCRCCCFSVSGGILWHTPSLVVGMAFWPSQFQEARFANCSDEGAAWNPLLIWKVNPFRVNSASIKQSRVSSHVFPSSLTYSREQALWTRNWRSLTQQLGSQVWIYRPTFALHVEQTNRLDCSYPVHGAATQRCFKKSWAKFRHEHQKNIVQD